jgi:predicted lipoprotein with Yx(FWY)xxD motif
MKRVVAAVLVIIILAVGGYTIFHKSNTDNNSTKSSNSSSKSSKSSTAAVNSSVLITKTDSTLGQYLADPSGKALYTYNADSNSSSNCTGSCLATWPAYVDKGSTTGLPTGVSVFKRTDTGQMQYALKGRPLYYFAGDNSGKVTGDGVENFKVARPDAATSSSSSSQPSSNSPNSQPSNASSNNSSSGNPY